MPSSGDEDIGGGVAEGLGGVADAFRSNFRTRGEVGAAVAVYRDGELVVDLWGGWRDRQRARRWESDTLVPVFSATKGMCAVAHGYHAQTLGWYESQLLRRADPARRSIGAFFADEVAAALGVQFFIGVSDDAVLQRLATFSGGGRIGAALHAHQMPKRLLLAMLNPRSMTARAFMNPRALAMNMSSINRPDVLRLEFPSMNGVGEVRAIAKVYGALAVGGSQLGLARSTLDELETVITPSFDEIFRLDSAFTMGFMKPFPILPFGSTPKSYGHTGLGGSFGFADPGIGLGYAYAMNRGGYSLPTDPRETALRDALYRNT